MSLTVVLQASRPPFLILSPLCVGVGWASAHISGAPISPLHLTLIFLAALLAHVAVNTFNEWFDFHSGLDATTQRTPFSGGSGALPAQPHYAPWVLVTAIVTTLAVVVIGLWFVLQRGLAILPLGIVGVVLIVAYTRWLNRSPLLCLVAPGLGFGILMVVGTHLLLSGDQPASVWLLALVPFFTSNNLLLLNQYPDIEADRRVGRHHAPIAWGITVSNALYGGQLLAAALLLLALGLAEALPSALLWCLPALLPGALALYGAHRLGANITSRPGYLAANVVTALLTPLSMMLALRLG